MRVKLYLTAFAAASLWGGAAVAVNNPIPGIDIIVRKQPGGSALKAVSDEAGRFTMRVAEPGQYVVSTACRSACPPHSLSVSASGAALKPSADMTYGFTVSGAGAVVLTGAVATVGDATAAGTVTSTSRSNIERSPR